MENTIRPKYLVLSLVVFSIMFSLAWQISKAGATESHTVPSNLKIDMNRALEIAKQNGGGNVSEIELERENGEWFYEAELDLPGGGEKEILINAQTGEVTVGELEKEGSEDKDDDRD